MSDVSRWKLHTEDFEVRDCPLADAQALVREHHYARGGSSGRVYCHGLYHKLSDLLVGVAWWIPPTRDAAMFVNRENWQKVLALTRMVMVPGAPANACSFLLSRSVKAIRKEGRYVTLLTYADQGEGHTGHVYRASGWTYLGETSPSQKWVDPMDGFKMVANKVWSGYRTKVRMQELGYMQLPPTRKHKFVLHLRPAATAFRPGFSSPGASCTRA
jgi:hypothetical protein